MRWYISTYITKEEEKKKTTVNSQRSGTYQKPSVSVSRNTDFSERKKRGKTRGKKTENREQQSIVSVAKHRLFSKAQKSAQKIEKKKIGALVQGWVKGRRSIGLPFWHVILRAVGKYFGSAGNIWYCHTYCTAKIFSIFYLFDYGLYSGRARTICKIIHMAIFMALPKYSVYSIFLIMDYILAAQEIFGTAICLALPK